jgi:hypothetical protein
MVENVLAQINEGKDVSEIKSELEEKYYKLQEISQIEMNKVLNWNI